MIHISCVCCSLNLKVRQGSLVAVVGTVGSGKTSLVSAILGETQRCAGRVVVKGSVAYVPQQAWCQNATLRDNITFGKHFNQENYDRTVEACALGVCMRTCACVPPQLSIVENQLSCALNNDKINESID